MSKKLKNWGVGFKKLQDYFYFRYGTGEHIRLLTKKDIFFAKSYGNKIYIEIFDERKYFYGIDKQINFVERFEYCCGNKNYFFVEFKKGLNK